MDNLEKGLVRVIGRYWSPDSLHKTKLVVSNSGMYIYRLEAGDYRAIKKMMLIK